MATKPFLSQIAVPVGTTTGDVYYPQTSLLMHFNGTNGSTTMTDNSKNNFTVTANGNAQISTAQSKFGGTSAYFDGTGDNLLLNYNTALHLAGDFTIEVWFYAISLNSSYILNFAGGASIAWASYLLFVDSGGIYFAASSANNGYDIGSEGSATGRIGTVNINTWNHVSVTRQGNIYRGYINGVQGYTQTLALTPYNPNARGLSIGGNYANTWGVTPVNSINGYIDDLRITNGIARYTSNFTPPTTQFLDSAGDANSSVVVNSTATGFAIGTGGINGAQLAKAWVNFSGSSPAVIRDSYNVSSITNNGTGDYTINYATTFSNANYCVNASAREFAIFAAAGGNITTGSVKVSVYNSAIALANTTHVFVSVFGN